MKNIFLSIIIPAFNEEHRLPRTLEQVFDYLQKQSYESEVIVVENGSTDKTYQVAQTFLQVYENLSVIREVHAGKGKAVRLGMLNARGAYRFMCDADLSMPIEEIAHFLPPQLDDFDIAIASRESPNSVRINEPYYRHFGGRFINAIIRWYALPNLHDTQCGFKCFRADVADDIFQYQQIDGWAFDVEVLYIARKRGYKIIEIPIHWYFNPETKLSPFKDAVSMIADIARVKRYDKKGYYDKTN